MTLASLASLSFNEIAPVPGCVAKCFRCGGIFNGKFIANFQESVSVKELTTKLCGVLFDSQCRLIV